MSHLTDLRDRLGAAGIDAAVLAAADEPDKATVATARRKVLDQGLEDRSTTPAMSDTPSARLRRRALYGHWDRFPVNPDRWYVLAGRRPATYVPKGRTFALTRQLRSEAEDAARRLLDDASVDAIAESVAWALEDLPLDALAMRSGRISGGGYVHETEAAWEILEEAVEPFLADLRRRAGLGLDATVAVAAGIVAGLYRCREPENGTVVAYAGPDSVSELADEVMNEATPQLASPHRPRPDHGHRSRRMAQLAAGGARSRRQRGQRLGLHGR